jgi:hypothetical protein
MNSTNPASSDADKKKLLDISEKIFVTGSCLELTAHSTGDVDSYYCDRSKVTLFDSEIGYYDFDTPAELRNMLQKMWEYQHCEYMKEFAVVATISTFRYKTEECVETGIPVFIYQF